MSFVADSMTCRGCLKVLAGLFFLAAMISSGAAALGSYEGSTIQKDNTWSANDYTGKIGYIVQPNTDLYGFEIKFETIYDASQQPDSIQVVRDSDGTVLVDKNISVSPGNFYTYQLDSINFSKGTKYRILVFNDDGQTDFAGVYNANLPYTSSDFDVVNGWVDGATSSNLPMFYRVTALKSTSVPELNSLSTFPQTWKYGDTPGFEINVSDPDVGGTGNNGTFSGETLHNGNISGASWTSGRYGGALSFDGSDQVDVGDIDGSGTVDSMAILGSFKLTKDSSGNKAILRATNYPCLLRAEYSRNIAFVCFNQAGQFSKIKLIDNIPLNTEISYLGVFDNGEMRLYKEGKGVIGTNSLSGTLRDGNSYTIGAGWVGNIDQVGVWNSTPTDSQARALVNSNSFYRGKSLGFWRLNAGQGSTAYDTHTRVSRFNKVGDGGVSFNGVDDLINASNINTVDKNSAFSISGSFKASDTTGNEQIFQQAKSSSNRVAIMLKGDKLTAGIYDGNSYFVSASGTFQADRVENYTVRFDGNNDFDLFLNGQEQTGTDTPFASTARLILGSNSFGFQRAFNGSLYSTCIHDKFVSSSQIQQIHSEGCMSVQDGLVASYQFENATQRPEERQKNILDYSVIPEVKLDVLDDGVQQVTSKAVEALNWFNPLKWTTYRIENSFNVDSLGWFNSTFQVVDEYGVSGFFEEDQEVVDSAPQVTIDSPSGAKYDYDLSWQVSTSKDGDDVSNENLDCTLGDGQGTIASFTVTEGNSKSGSFRRDLGSYTLSVSCTEQKADSNTGSDSQSFSVSAIGINSVSSKSPVFETEKVDYNSDIIAGDMTRNTTAYLYWNGESKDSTLKKHAGSCTSGTCSYPVSQQNIENSFRPPLVQNNATQRNWYVKYQVVYEDFSGGTYSTKNFSSATKSQTLYWAYYIENHDTNPASGKYIETEDLEHEVKIHTETKKADIDGTTTYKRNGETDAMEKIVNTTSSSTFLGKIDVGKAASFNKSTFNVESSFDLSFKGSSRQLTTGNDAVKVYRIKLTDGSTSLNTAKALVFDIIYEENRYDTKAKLSIDLSLWKNRDELIRRFSFRKSAAKKHSFYIYPAWAEYKIRTLPYDDQRKFDLIQYYNSDTNKVRRSYFFPTVQTISNTTTTVPLKTINRSEAQSIDFSITNSEGDPAANVYCRVDRKFAGGNFETVFMIKTGGNGKSQSFAEVNEIYYGFTCYKNGKVQDRFSAQILQDPVRLQLGGGEVPTTLDYYQKFDAACTSGKTYVNCSYQSQTAKLQKAVLTVERQEVVKDIQVCSTSSPTVTGKLVCTGLNTSKNRYEYRVIGDYPRASTQGVSGFLGNIPKPYPLIGLFMTAIVFMFVTAATAFNLKIGIGAGTLSLVLMSSINWIVLTPSQKATLIAVAILAGVAVNQ